MLSGLPGEAQRQCADPGMSVFLAAAIPAISIPKSRLGTEQFLLVSICSSHRSGRSNQATTGCCLRPVSYG